MSCGSDFFCQELTLIYDRNYVVITFSLTQLELAIYILLEIDPRKRGIDVGAILCWVGNDIAIIAILL